MDGLMQDWPLIVNRALDYAARFHAEQTVVSWAPELEGGRMREVTYLDLQRRSRLCSLALLGLGVRAGDVVATLAWNSSRHMECWYGIMGIGAVCHTLNPRLFEKDLEYIINHAGDVVIMADAMFAPLLARLLPHCPCVRHVVLLSEERGMPNSGTSSSSDAAADGADAAGGGGGGVPLALCYEALLQGHTAAEPAFRWEVPSEHMAAGLCYTSGTTGRPKGVLYSHRSNYLHAMAGLLADVLCLGSDKVVLMVVPMFHANSWGLVFQGPMVGARLILPGPNLDGASTYRLLQEHRVTTTAAVPTVLLGLLEHLREKRLALSTLRLIMVGGAACPASLMEEYEERHGVTVLHAWGMTESSPVGTNGRPKGTLPAGMSRAQLRAVKLKQGRPHMFCDMRVVDGNGRELPWDGVSVGAVQVRGPTVLRQYYKADAPAVDADGQWFDTGDVGTMDALGHMQITDRSKDVIKSGGEWISSIEIENLAVGHPQVAEAAVIGIPDAKWDERPLLVVVPTGSAGQGLTREGVLAFLEGKLAKWWMPDDVVFVDEIPHTATGKISKLDLRRQLAGYKPPRSKM